MAQVDELARFALRIDGAAMSPTAREQLRIRILDTLGVAIAAQNAPPMRAIRELTAELGGAGLASLIGGGRTAPDRAAFYNTALSRYLDFMDSYLAPGETCHPSDNIAAVLAAAETVGATGDEFMTAAAVAYQVHARLSDVAPVRAKGFDHTVQGIYAVAAGVSRALGLPADATANAIAIAGTANNALRVTRTGDLSHWKGLAYPQVAKEAMHAALLARAGITGPRLVFEGNKGFCETIAGSFEIAWADEDLEAVTRTIVKKHNAEIHSQTALDAAIDVTGQPGFDARRIRAVRVETFQVAYDIIGGGEEGDKRTIRTKEEADHSLPYLVAVALLDGEAEPAQLEPERINADDVQEMMHRVTIAPREDFTQRFPAEMPSRVEIELDDGRTLTAEAATYRGSVADPLDWAGAVDKYRRLVLPFAGQQLTGEIADVVRNLESHTAADLAALMARVSRSGSHTSDSHPAVP